MQAKMSNNGEARLASPIDTDDTTLYLQAGQGALFRPLAAGEWAPLTIIDSAGNFEIVKATALAGDTFTIERHQEGTTARAFSAGDRVQNRLTAAVLDELKSAMSGIPSAMQNQLYTAFASDGSAPNFTLTPAPALTAYGAGQRFRVKFHAAGAGDDTLNVSNLGAKSIKQYDSTGVKVPAVIAADQLTDVEYDGDDFVILDPLPVTSLPGFRNRIINGAFKIDQRNSGAVQTYTAGTALLYGIDRWYGYCSGANVTGQQITLASRQNRYRFTGAASNTAVGIGQRIEASDSMDVAGSTATLQIKASSSSLTSLTWTAYYANSADSFGSLASPTRTQIATGTFTISAAEATYSAQIAIPAAATTGIEIVFSGGALLAAQTLTIGDVQLERGVVATPFEQRPMAAELALSQRYYEKTFFTNSMYNGGASTGAQFGHVSFKVPKRVTPSVVLSGITYSNSSGAAVGNNTPTSISLNVNIAAVGIAFLYGHCLADAEL